MDITTTVSDIKKYFRTDITKDVRFRKAQLIKLKEAIEKHEGRIMNALKADLNKAPQESYMTEIGIVLDEIKCALKHIDHWAKRKMTLTPLSNFPAYSYIYTEPYGTVLIIAPWNYPFQLALTPLVGAIAAGNCAVLKPSEFSSHVSAVIAKIIRETFDAHYITVVEGAVEESQALLKEKFDDIFFTGSPAVGQIVMKAAAENLTPVTLELGGKSPCIVHASADIDSAAKRIVFGKFLNSGQTCVAPDYVLVDHMKKKELLFYLKKYIKQFFGDDPIQNPDYPKIITEHHFKRLLSLMEGEILACGGNSDAVQQKIAPTILENATWDSPAMREEIFGPILPVITYDYIETAMCEVASREKPLALYIFAKDTVAEETILHSLSFGGGCVNDTIIHLLSSRMPFGGIGKSGMGSYHGKFSFDTFSHKKSVVKKAKVPDIPLRYHPYSEKKLRWIRRFLG